MKSQSITISISPKTARTAIAWLRGDLREIEQGPAIVRSICSTEIDAISRLTQQLEGALEQADA